MFINEYQNNINIGDFVLKPLVSVIIPTLNEEDYLEIGNEDRGWKWN